MSQPIDLQLLLSVPFVDPDLGFEISPSGDQVAFSWNLSGRWEIYIQQLAGNTSPRQVSYGEGAKFSPRWRPDGQQLAYVCDLDGSENYDILVYDFPSGQQGNLTPGTPEAIMSGYDWSPDGKWIAYCSNLSGRFDTYVIPASGGQARKVLNQKYTDYEVFWSPDGSTLAVVVEGPGQDFWTYLVPLEGQEPYPITINGQVICAKNACWAPDGRSIAFSSDQTGRFEIGLYQIDTGSVTWLTAGEGEKEKPDWSANGLLTFTTSFGPRTELALMQFENGTLSHNRIEPGVVYSPKFTPNGENIILVFDNPCHPDDLWSFSIKTKAFKQLTFSLPQTIDQEGFRLPEEILYPSLDGVQVPALLYHPAHTGEQPPAVIYVHGGPNWLTQITWDPMIQHMVSRGWVVLAPNYRGSTGYGRDWQLASRFDFGGVDTADVVAGMEYLSKQGIAHRGKIAVTGRSWGGYLTMTCLTQYPDHWAAGSAVVPFLNWFTGHANSREDLQHWDRENFGDPETDHDLWYQRSPYFFLDRVLAPVQLICGAQDVRCPQSESAQAHEQLTALGKVCEYNLYPDEGHSFLKVENRVKSRLQQVDFLAKYLESDGP